MRRMTDFAIRVDDIKKHFGDVHALSGVSFNVEAGTVYGLLGPNGAGKTTVVRILSTILQPDGGRAEVLGHDVVKEEQTVRRIIGLAGQYAAVDANLTGRENLRLVGKLTHLPKQLILDRAQELLERFDLVEAGDRPLRTYSGGMRRRLDVAAALVARPPVLFLDEPTTGLDVFTRGALWDMLRELVAEGTTIVLTTQYLEEADQLASRIAVVDKGRVVAEDTPTQLKAQLGDTVIEVGMGEEPEAIRTAEILSSLDGSKAEREGSVVRLTTDQGSKALIEGLRSLDNAGLAPVTLDVRQPSLDDVFIALTGHHAEEAEEVDPVPAAAGRGKKR
jgi:daunorubicin resistance ABC transporter ATP-binding subunit